LLTYRHLFLRLLVEAAASDKILVIDAYFVGGFAWAANENEAACDLIAPDFCVAMVN
jgi:hypothetical protein